MSDTAPNSDSAPPRPWRASLTLLALACALTAISLSPANPIRTAVGLAFALTLPGLALLSAALDAESIGSPLTAFGMAVIVTLALYALIALALDGAGVALSHTAFLAAADVVVVACCAWNIATRRQIVVSYGDLASRLRGAALPVAATATAVAVTFVMADLPGTKPAPFQAIYATGSGASSGAADPVLGGRATVGVAVKNGTGASRSYRLTAVLQNGIRWPARRISVRAGATWRGSLTGPVRATKCQSRLQITLLDGSNERLLSELSVWLGSSSHVDVICRA